MTTLEKQQFLQEQFTPMLSSLKAEQAGNWGVLRAQEMVEHFTDAVHLAYGKFSLPVITQGEQLEKMIGFLRSEKPFGQNIRNPFMSEVPPPLRKPDMATAIVALQDSINRFFNYYDANPSAQHVNPFFGELNFELQLQLLTKHAIHHLQQFGIEPFAV